MIALLYYIYDPLIWIILICKKYEQYKTIVVNCLKSVSGHLLNQTQVRANFKCTNFQTNLFFICYVNLLFLNTTNTQGVYIYN